MRGGPDRPRPASPTPLRPDGGGRTGPGLQGRRGPGRRRPGHGGRGGRDTHTHYPPQRGLYLLQLQVYGRRHLVSTGRLRGGGEPAPPPAAHARERGAGPLSAARSAVGSRGLGGAVLMPVPRGLLARWGRPAGLGVPSRGGGTWLGCGV